MILDPNEERRLYALQEVRQNNRLDANTPESIVAAAAQFEEFMKSGVVPPPAAKVV